MQKIKQWMKRGLIVAAAAMCALSVQVPAAQAALVNYSFTGSMSNLDPLLFPVSGTVQFNNESSTSGGVYNGVVTGFTLNLGGIYASTFAAGANAVTISQNTPMSGGSGDRWALVSAATGSDLNGFTPFRFDLRVDRLGGGLFSDTTLQDPPSFSALNNPMGVTGRWRLFFEDADGNPAVFLGSITSLTAVPLPTAVLLFGAGLISLVGLGAGGLRNLRASKV